MPSSPRTRPLSILSQFKARGHRQKPQKPTGSELPPPSLDKVPSRPPTALKVDRMAPTLKERGGRLQAFARGTPEPNATQNHSHDHSHRNRKRSETPQSTAPVAPTRQEIVESAKLPIPKGGRHAAPHQRDGSVASQPAPQSPPHVGHPSQQRRPRASSNDRQDTRDPHEALFNGSQLGEGFMKSGLTTPHNERADAMSEVMNRNKKSPVSLSHHPLFRSQFEQGARSSEDAAFFLGDDGFMTVVTGGSRHGPPNMKDGFDNANMNARSINEPHNRSNHQLPTSPAERHAKLPVREVKVKRSHSTRREDPAMMDDTRVLSPTIESSRWQAQNRSHGGSRPTLFRDVDIELDSCAELEEPQSTPKAPRTKPPPQKSLMESSMPVTKASRDEGPEKKRRRGSPDYDDKVLSSMAYSQLQNEAFDHNPAAVTAQSSSEAKADDYASMLARYFPKSETEQRNMFANMSIHDWEASGDWFIDQFADLMHKLRDARQEKRRVVRTFEDEIAHREESVRMRSDIIDRKLIKMKQDGQRVVEDKEL
ncbi:hypothetical protein HJFPF1_03213 [Paramyrothecium foliicola]|nr:hypothetical protein HJFPF1_03213 [Paramyrothecium foliicola]